MKRASTFSEEIRPRKVKIPKCMLGNSDMLGNYCSNDDWNNVYTKCYNMYVFMPPGIENIYYYYPPGEGNYFDFSGNTCTIRKHKSEEPKDPISEDFSTQAFTDLSTNLASDSAVQYVSSSSLVHYELGHANELFVTNQGRRTKRKTPKSGSESNTSSKSGFKSGSKSKHTRKSIYKPTPPSSDDECDDDHLSDSDYVDLPRKKQRITTYGAEKRNSSIKTDKFNNVETIIDVEEIEDDESTDIYEDY